MDAAPSYMSAFAAYQAQASKAPPKAKASKKKQKSKPTKIVPQRPTRSAASNVPASNGRVNKRAATDDSPQPKKNAKQAKKNDTPKSVARTSIDLTYDGLSQARVFTEPQLNGAGSNSIAAGEQLFEQLLQPIQLKEFMSDYWEKQVLCINRKSPDYYKHLHVSSRAIDTMLRTNSVEFTKNIDITSYENGERQTLNPDGRALPATVWEHYAEGCSVRLLNPQTFMPSLWKLNSVLQEYFHCLVGANLYLTPANSQGFAPHYDDIEAFVLQMEGKKLWRIYKPRSEAEMLPRESSGNFGADEIGECVFEKVLEPGDLLYFPRGWIHQAKTIDGQHSLHVTLSVYQKTAYADLFTEVTKQALDTAIASNIDFRRGLPLDIWHSLGAVHADRTHDVRRANIKSQLRQMFEKLINHADFDGAVDRLAMKFQHDALPPKLAADESALTVFGNATRFEKGRAQLPEFDIESSRVRLLRANILRLVHEDDVYRLYYHIDNSKEYHGSEMNFVEVDETAADVVKRFVRTYPDYIAVSELQAHDDEDGEAISVVQNLWDRGLLATERPLK